MEYSIKQVSEKTNLTPHTLRYYEKEGLLPFIKRTSSGIRRFSDDDLDWLGLISCLKNTGMSINHIKEFVELSAKGDETLGERCKILLKQRANVENEIKLMRDHLDKVNRKIEYFTAQYEEYQNKLAN